MMTMELPASTGFAAWCATDGMVLRVAHDSLGLAPHLAPRQSIGLLVEQGSLRKLFNFLLTVQEQGAAFDWELNVPVAGEIETLHFAGVSVGDGLLISGARTRANLWHLYDELLGITNEQANLLRNLVKDMGEVRQANPAFMSANAERDLAIYDEISRFNNELVNLQRELIKKTAELGRLNDLKNQFLGMAAHDLRNPLGSILSYSQFVLSSANGRLNEEEQEFLRLISSQADFMLDIVTDLLDIAAIESGKLQLDRRSTNLAELIAHVIAIYRPIAANKQMEIAQEVAGSPPPLLLLDHSRLEQVLSNLFSNAIKYSEPNTTVTVTVTDGEDEVRIAVSDQGQGIPAGELSRLFQPFSTTSVKATAGEKSTGLGLTIAKRVIEANGGRIAVQSTQGSGSTFTLTLPKQPGAPAAPAVPEDPAPPLSHRPLRILLAEDNTVNQHIALRILEKMGYHADVVSTGAAALAAVHDRQYDLVLMDIYMPEMDGLEAAQRIRVELPPDSQPTIIALTASVSDESRSHFLAAGMDGWVEKATLNRSSDLRQLLASCPPAGQSKHLSAVRPAE